MLVNKPEDRPKVIALSVLIVFCILYFFVMILPRLLHAGSQAPHTNQAAADTASPPPAPAVATGPAPSGGPATGASVTVAQRQIGSDADTDATGGPFPAPARDPFRPPTPGPSAVPPPVLQPPHPTQVAFVKPAKPTSLPPISLPPFGGPDSAPKGAGGPGTLGVNSLPVPAPLPEVALKGVIPGSPAVAVLQIGSETLHKYPGELLTPDVRLTQITDEGVVLKHGKQRITLEVGHSTKEASTGVQSENGITTADATSQRPAKQPAAKPAGKAPVRAAGKQPGKTAIKVAAKPASREVATSSLPSAHTPAPRPQKHIVFYRAHRRRKHYALYIHRNGHFMPYRPGSGWHALYIRRHGRFVRYHLRHRRHSTAA